MHNRSASLIQTGIDRAIIGKVMALTEIKAPMLVGVLPCRLGWQRRAEGRIERKDDALPFLRVPFHRLMLPVRA